jgi:hypothetical protein
MDQYHVAGTITSTLHNTDVQNVQTAIGAQEMIKYINVQRILMEKVKEKDHLLKGVTLIMTKAVVKQDILTPMLMVKHLAKTV